MREVSISQVDLSDSHVHGPEDFTKGTSPEEMEDCFRRWQSIVRPAVQRGAGPQYFEGLDAQFGVDPAKGYKAMYDIFYGDLSAIRLDWGGDRYTVVNGYHRLYVAQKLGLSSVPAWITGRQI